MKTGRTWHTSSNKIQRSMPRTQVSCFVPIISSHNSKTSNPISQFLQTLKSNSNEMSDEELIVESNHLLSKVSNQFGFEFSEFETYNQLKYMLVSLINSFRLLQTYNQKQFSDSTIRNNNIRTERSSNKRSSIKPTQSSKKLPRFQTKILNYDGSSENHILVDELDEIQIDFDLGQYVQSIKKDSSKCKKCPTLLQCYEHLMETLIQFQDQRQLQLQKLKEMNNIISNHTRENQQLKKEIQVAKHELQSSLKANQLLKQQIQEEKKLHEQMMIADSLSTIYQSPQLETRFLLIQAISIQSMLPKSQE